VQAEILAPTTTLQVTVPDYVVSNDVSTTQGLDWVTIPGGKMWTVEGQLWLPYYQATVEYPPGYEVQDVMLIDRSGLSTTTGLDIPMVPLTITACACSPVAYEGPVEGWFPEEVYGWETLEHPDGSSTLVVVMYPFYYNTLTTDVEFYTQYTFEVNYTVSTVTATVATGQAEHEPGDVVPIHVGLDAVGDPQDVAVSVLLRRYGTAEVVDSLLLETLAGLSGKAAFSPQWDSGGAEPGLYYVEVTLRDPGGDVLDRQTETFVLGAPAGAITGFDVAPDQFEAGDDVGVTLVFSNTGTVPITGTTVVRILNGSGGTVQEFRHDVTGLPPGSDVSFGDVWDTSGASGGTYTVVGHAQYDSTTSDPVSAVVTGTSRVYLPLVLRNL
jgi:hypothetical protein